MPGKSHSTRRRTRREKAAYFHQKMADHLAGKLNRAGKVVSAPRVHNSFTRKLAASYALA